MTTRRRKLGLITSFKTSASDRNSKEVKAYAPGVGLVVSGTLRLVDWTPAH